MTAILETAPALARARENTQVVIADKAYYGREFEAGLHAAGIKMLRPAREGEKPGTSTGSSNHCARSSSPSTPPSRANSTSDATEARPPDGVCARIAQRVLALTAAIWHNDNLGSPSGDH